MTCGYVPKATWESFPVDFDCTARLPAGAVVSSIDSVSADVGGLSFGTPIISTAAVTYPDGRTAAIGKMIQVEVSGGTIPAGADDTQIGVPNLLCTLRVRFYSSLSPERYEVYGQILLKDAP